MQRQLYAKRQLPEELKNIQLQSFQAYSEKAWFWATLEKEKPSLCCLNICF